MRTLKSRFDAAALRGDKLHQQEEARFHLHLLERRARALSLARENWTLQREPRDARILLEAALAANDPRPRSPRSTGLRVPATRIRPAPGGCATRGLAAVRLLALLLVLAAAPALAHKPSDSYLALTVDGTRVEGQWDIALRDLDFAIGLDANADGDITWGEVRARHADIAAYALARLALRSGAAPCPTRVTEHLVDDHSDGAYAVLRFVAICPDSI